MLLLRKHKDQERHTLVELTPEQKTFREDIARNRPGVYDANTSRYCPDALGNFIHELHAHANWQKHNLLRPGSRQRRQAAPVPPALILHNVPLFTLNEKKTSYIRALDRTGNQMRVGKVVFKHMAGYPGGLVISPEAYGLILGPLKGVLGYDPLLGTKLEYNAANIVEQIEKRGLCIERYIDDRLVRNIKPCAISPYSLSDSYNVTIAALTEEYECLYRETKRSVALARNITHIRTSAARYLHDLLAQQGFNPPPFSLMERSEDGTR